METLERILSEHPFFEGMSPEHLRLLTGCARNHRFDAGQYLCHAGDKADEFFLIRQGRVALEILPPGRAPVVIQTAQEGEIVGVTWLMPPYIMVFDARAVEMTRAIGIDAACLRGKCDADHDLGYSMMQRFLPILSKRLQVTRLQLLDVYGRR